MGDAHKALIEAVVRIGWGDPLLHQRSTKITEAISGAFVGDGGMHGRVCALALAVAVIEIEVGRQLGDRIPGATDVEVTSLARAVFDAALKEARSAALKEARSLPLPPTAEGN